MSPIASVTVLGAGAMGARMAGKLAAAGYDVQAWDPRPERSGAASAAEAVEGADVVLTMAPDGPAVDETMFGAGGVADAMRSDALWLQTSTVGARWAERFAGRAEERGLLAVDAPVIGTLPQAESGTLVFFATGPEDARLLAQPLLDVIGARTLWYERPGDGQRMKLSLNGYLLTAIELLAESLALVEAVGLEPGQFIEIMGAHAAGSQLLREMGPAMLAERFDGGLSVALAEKDLGLVLEQAEEAGVELELAAGARRKLARAAELGYPDANAAAAIVATRPAR